MRVAFIGFGLIGGSVARALRRAAPASEWSLTAWSPSGNGPAQAADDGVIDRAARTPRDAIEGADLIVLAGPATRCLDALDALAATWRPALGASAVITDVASTKAAILDRANALGLRFVGGHPMAGLDVTGYAMSRADLFENRPWVIVPGGLAERDDVARVEALAVACAGRPMLLDAQAHDRAVAGISHLPLIVAAALVEAVAGGSDPTPADWPTAALLAAGGWRDMTRLARGDPAMGAGIVATNTNAIRERLTDLEAVLSSWRQQLESEMAEDTFRGRLDRARRRLDEGT